MFDPDLYRKTCSEGLKLSEETLEEMIFMTENKKRGLRRPLQIALTAAALAAVMCVTAAAANPEAVKELWESITMSAVVLRDDGDTMIVQTEMPEISVDRVGERVMLTVEDVTTDITDTLDRDGVYTQTFASENGDAKLTVKADLTWEMELDAKDGQQVRYNSESFEFSLPADLEEKPAIADEESGVILDPGDDSVVTYTFTDDETMNDATYLPPEE